MNHERMRIMRKILYKKCIVVRDSVEYLSMHLIYLKKQERVSD
jgi:hypothetical protein